jgi:hypothetical protein
MSHTQSMLGSRSLQFESKIDNNPFSAKDDDFILNFKDDIKDIKYDKQKENDYFIEVTEDELISRLMEETDPDMKEFCKLI